MAQQFVAIAQKRDGMTTRLLLNTREIRYAYSRSDGKLELALVGGRPLTLGRDDGTLEDLEEALHTLAGDRKLGVVEL